MRLIDADPFGVIFLQGKSEEFIEGVKFMLEKIDEAPTLERPHGEWVDEGLYAENACQHVYQCTHCKEHIVEYPSEMGSYCKYCGSDNRKKSPCDYCIDDSDCDRCDVPLERR